MKNSAMFAKEQQNYYDPSRPNILDGRPLSTGQGNALNHRFSESLRSSNSFSQTDSAYADKIDARDFASSPSGLMQLSPSKLNSSPAKSSLSKKTGANMRHSGFDPDTGIWEDEDISDRKLPEGRGLHRHAKSVTFDQAPPQINEYEMTTPDPSSIASDSREGSYESTDDEDDELNFERCSSNDHDDSFDASLEDTDKTPIVLPEDWRFMSPEAANTHLAQHEEDVFEDDLGSPPPGAEPGRAGYRPHQTSVNSIDSNGQPRPLPPLPGREPSDSHGPVNRDSLSDMIERMSSGQRALPSPPAAASISKSDLRRMSGGSLSIEDRLRLMMVKEQGQQKPEADLQRERRMRRAGSKDLSAAREESVYHDAEEISHSPEAAPSGSAPRLSRLSISQQLQDTQAQEEVSEDGASSASASEMLYDPDVPIPSLEDPTQDRDEELEIKVEDSDTLSLSSIPSYYGQATEDQFDTGDEETSQYSEPSVASQPLQHNSLAGHETPRARSPVQEPAAKLIVAERVSLPDFTDFGDESSFNFGLNDFMTPPIESNLDKPLPAPPTQEISLPDLAALRQNIQRPYTPEEQLEPPKLSFSGDESSADPGTPNSVIRHPVSTSPEVDVKETDSIGEDSKFTVREPLSREESAVSEESRTEDQEQIQSPQHLEPHDLIPSSQKRVSSLVRLELTTEKHDDDLGLGLGLEREFDRVVESQKVEFELSLQHLYYPFSGRFPSGDHSASAEMSEFSMYTQVPRISPVQGVRACVDMPRPLSPFKAHDKSIFANASPGRQRGYLMRQNTKIVVASERPDSSEEMRQTITIEEPVTPGIPSGPNEVHTSTRKASQPTWTAEPWNGKARRKSIRLGGEKAIAKRKPVEGPVPPLPGHVSNVNDALGAVVEDELAEEEAEEFEEGVERGRLFVKVVGVKDLQLPFPQRK